MLPTVQPDIAISKLPAVVKANSSQWVSETFASLRSSSLLCEPTPPKQLRLRRPEAATQGEAESLRSTSPEASVAPCGGLIAFDNSVHGLTPVATCCRAARSDERPSTRPHVICSLPHRLRPCTSLGELERSYSKSLIRAAPCCPGARPRRRTCGRASVRSGRS